MLLLRQSHSCISRSVNSLDHHGIMVSRWRAAICTSQYHDRRPPIVLRNFNAVAASAAAALAHPLSLSTATSQDQTGWHQASFQLPRTGYYNMKTTDLMRPSQFRLHSSASEHENDNYVQIGGPIDESICNLSETKIHDLVRERRECRLNTNFGSFATKDEKDVDYERADSIREELRTCGVHIDDRAKVWRADGKSFVNEFGHSYVRVGGPIDESKCDLSETEIHNLIRERMECKQITRDYERGDHIYEELVQSGIFIDDINTLWRGDGKRSFPGKLIQQTIEDIRNS